MGALAICQSRAFLVGRVRCGSRRRSNLVRVSVLITIATLIWVPIGVAVGLRPRLTEKVQPLAQFLAAFPANLLFPIAVFLIVRFDLSPVIWLSPLMILGTQWYILFNVIAGASAFPSDFREAAASFRMSGWHWWRDVMLPGIFPYYVTGAITASGRAWNATLRVATAWGRYAELFAYDDKAGMFSTISH